MKLAIFGGTFNPLHVAHAMLADAVATELRYDKVHIVPAFLPPHKQMSAGVSAEQRLLMVKAFCERDARFVADGTEIERGGVSYTYYTVCAIVEKYGDKLDGKPALIMGQENAGEFHKWHRAAELAEMCDIVIARRHPDLASLGAIAGAAGAIAGAASRSIGDYTGGTAASEQASGSESAAASEQKSPRSESTAHSEKNKPIGDYTGAFATDEEIASFAFPHKFLNNALLPLSSTEIRERIASGKSFRYLVPEPIFEYIKNNRLYGYGDK